MLGIVKDKHQKFCKMVSNFRVNYAATDKTLEELDKELIEIFGLYNQTMGNLRTIIYEYEVKQKEIRQRMKALLSPKNNSRKHIPLMTKS